MIEICKENQIKTLKVTYEVSNDRNFQTNRKTRKSKLTCSVSLTNYDVGSFCRNKSWKWTYVVLNLKKMKYGLSCVLFFPM